MEFLSKVNKGEHSINHNFMNKSLLFRSISVGIMSVMVLCVIAIPQATYAETKNAKNDTSHTLFHKGKLTICKLDKEAYEVVRTIEGKLSAYTNTVDQTDDSPDKTASGFSLSTLKAGEGVVANNFLPLGTKVRIPDLFGDMVFTVEDRGSQKHFSTVNRFDVYIPGGEKARQQAMQFGRKTAKVEIIES